MVLAGGGHSHALVLRMLAMDPPLAWRVTLVSDVSHAPYSGMLPGLIGGAYAYDEAHIDLRRLCAAAGAVFVHSAVTGIEMTERRLLLADGPPLRYDVLSLNIGAEPAAVLPGLADHGIPVKPVGRLLVGWNALLATAKADSDRERTVVVVGAGAGGVEFALAIRRQLPRASRVVVLEHASEIMPGHNARARALMTSELQRAGVELRTGVEITSVDAGQVRGARGAATPFDALFYATPARPPAWLGTAGLAVTPEGFVRVQTTLRSISDPRVFAAGDVAAIEGYALPRAGVYAVRAAATLHTNLRRSIGKTPLVTYTPQRQALALIGLGDGRAIASRAGWAFRGKLPWRWKERIDRRFMERFTELPPMAAPGERIRCHGCAAKVGPAVLAGALANGRGPAERDDASLLEVAPGRLLVQSLDFVTALVSDPHAFGRIAAAHAFSDIYAMNATPDSALALITVPHAMPRVTEALVERLLSGVTRAMDAMGARLLGGHTAEGAETAIGLSVNGFAVPSAIWRKGGLRPGDALILTKALGTGTLFAAAMRQAARGRWLDDAVDAMVRNNAAARDVLAGFAVSACTDVTGFGLAGHLGEMLVASGVAAELALGDVPVLAGALETLAAGHLSSLDPANRSAESRVRAVSRQDPRYHLLFDPQTSGGLLAGVPAAEAARCVAALQAKGVTTAAVIGRVTTKGDPCLVVP